MSSLRVGHLQIDLGKFCLAVGAKILVAEAAHNLEILVEAGDHQNLLEHLWRLRQGVETAGLDAARNKVITRAFGRGARHVGRFNVEKALSAKIVANRLRDFVPHLDVELHGIAPQIDVTVLEAHFFVRQNRFSGKKWRLLGVVEDAQLVNQQLDFASGDVLVESRRIAPLDRAHHGDDVLVAQGFGFLVCSGVEFLIHDHLRDAATIAQVNEDEAAQVAAAVDPSHKHGLVAGIGGTQRATHVGTT